MKKLLIIPALIASGLTISVSAQACDMHGVFGNPYGQQSSPWQSYNPRASIMDPAMMEAEMEAQEAERRQREAEKQARRPSFSAAADNASRRAKANIAAKDEISKKAEPAKKQDARLLTSDR